MFEKSKLIRNYKGFEKRWENLYWKKNPGWSLQFKKFPDEKFAEIKGYYGFYFISNYGQVISFYHRFPRVRQLNFCNGFYLIQLSLLGTAQNYNIHDLVYTAFIGPKNPGQRIIHKNRITTDNYYKNLKSVGLSPLVKRIEGKLLDFSLFNQIEAEAENRKRQAIEISIVFNKQLARLFRCPVNPPQLAVNVNAAGKNKPLHFLSAAGLKNIGRSQNIALHSIQGTFVGLLNVRYSGKVENCLGIRDGALHLVHIKNVPLNHVMVFLLTQKPNLFYTHTPYTAARACPMLLTKCHP